MIVWKGMLSPLTCRVTTRTSVKTTLSPSSSWCFGAGVISSVLPTLTPISFSASSTVSAVSWRLTGFLSPIFTVSVLGVTTSSVRPSRSIEPPRLVESSAPLKRRPISPRAPATLVEVTQ